MDSLSQRGTIRWSFLRLKTITLLISVIVAIIAILIHYALINIPHVHSGFVVLLVGYLILAAGNVLRGI